MTKQQLKNGQEFFFNNEAFQMSIKNDDVREANVCFYRNWNYGISDFQIRFNGELLHSCKTFKSLKNRLEKLTTKWNLVEADEL